MKVASKTPSDTAVEPMVSSVLLFIKEMLGAPFDKQLCLKTMGFDEHWWNLILRAFEYLQKTETAYLKWAWGLVLTRGLVLDTYEEYPKILYNELVDFGFNAPWYYQKRERYIFPNLAQREKLETQYYVNKLKGMLKQGLRVDGTPIQLQLNKKAVDVLATGEYVREIALDGLATERICPQCETPYLDFMWRCNGTYKDKECGYPLADCGLTHPLDL